MLEKNDVTLLKLYEIKVMDIAVSLGQSVHWAAAALSRSCHAHQGRGGDLGGLSGGDTGNFGLNREL